MSNLIGKAIDTLSKPGNTTIVAALFLTSLLIFSLNFLPEKILTRMNILSFLNNYGYIVVIVLVLSCFILLIQGLTWNYNRLKDKKFHKYMKKQQDDLFNDSDAYKILEYMYESHPEPVKLPHNNQKVKLLRQYQLIILASNQSYLNWYEDLNNPMIPYLLQPIAEKRLEKLMKDS